MPRKKAKPPHSPATACATIVEARAGGAVLPDGVPAGALKRKETARLLGWSESKLRRAEGSVINPIVASNGHHFYRAEEVETIRRVRVDAHQKPSDYDGSTAARVFTLLDEGLNPVEIVKRTSLDWRVVAEIRDAWLSLLGGFIVTKEHLVAIEMMTWLQGAFPLGSADDLVDVLKQSEVGGTCTHCKEHSSDYCGRCVQRFAAAEEEAKQVVAERNRVALAKRRREIERSHEHSFTNTKRQGVPKPGSSSIDVKADPPAEEPIEASARIEPKRGRRA